MTYFKVNGLVINERELGDNDKLLTVISEQYGKLFIVGKGVKSLKNRHMCCSNLLSYASFGLKRRGKYYYIHESDLIESFYDIRNDIMKLSLSSYICDVLNHVIQEGTGEDSILRLTLNTLHAIMMDKQPLELIRASFQMKLLAECGMYPDLTECSLCKDENVKSGHLDLVDGVIICEKCRNNIISTIAENPFYERGLQKPIAHISKGIIDAINYIVSADSKRYLSFTISNEELLEFASLSEQFLINQLERSFYTLDFYKSML